jgi:hypothetical protein
MPLQQPQEVLEVLMAQAQGYADFSMRKLGHVPPLLIGASSQATSVRKRLLVCIAYNVTAVVLVLESWTKTATPDEPLNASKPPSEALDRQEVIVLAGEITGQQKQKLLPIIRSDNGRFFGFGEFTNPKLGHFEGRFAQLMPPKTPDAQAKLHAGAMLQSMGITEKSLRA